MIRPGSRYRNLGELRMAAFNDILVPTSRGAPGRASAGLRLPAKQRIQLQRPCAGCPLLRSPWCSSTTAPWSGWRPTGVSGSATRRLPRGSSSRICAALTSSSPAERASARRARRARRRLRQDSRQSHWREHRCLLARRGRWAGSAAARHWRARPLSASSVRSAGGTAQRCLRRPSGV